MYAFILPEPVGKGNHDIERSKEEGEVEARVAVGKMLALHLSSWRVSWSAGLALLPCPREKCGGKQCC